MKKIKITKRYLLIILISVILGTVLSIVWYSNLEKAAAPEEQISVLVFTRSLNENEILTPEKVKTVLKRVNVPKSIKPPNAITAVESLYDKTLIENAREGDYVVADMLTERGQTTFEAGDYWQVSIDVSELTNFLGLQLKRGDEYQMFFRKKMSDSLTNERAWGMITDEVYVVDIIDNLGNKVFEQREENIKSVILAMPDQDAYREIIRLKDDAHFELGKAPDNYRELQLLKEVPLDQQIFIDELMKEKSYMRKKGGQAHGKETN